MKFVVGISKLFIHGSLKYVVGKERSTCARDMLSKGFYTTFHRGSSEVPPWDINHGRHRETKRTYNCFREVGECVRVIRVSLG